MKSKFKFQRFFTFIFFLPAFFNLFESIGSIPHHIGKKIHEGRPPISKALYTQLNLCELGLNEKAFDAAIKGFDKLVSRGVIDNDQIITIIDFTKSSSQKRLFVIDLVHQQVLFHTYVAHGQQSGKDFACQFSNIPSSLQSSLGFYKTSNTYMGKNGYSMLLTGLEPGINDKAEERSIVMHGAAYVSESWIQAQGYIGRSWGCPAVPEALAKPIIDKIKNGSCLFIFAENSQYQSRSSILKS